MLKSAIDQCSESVFFTDTHGRILYVNDSCVRTSGYSREELIGKTPHVFNSGRHPHSFFQALWDDLLAGRIHRCRITNKRKDGTIYVEDSNTGPVRDQNGEIIGFVSVQTDITELLEQKRKLEAANQELSRSNADLEQFANVASHDLQEPLRSISSCMQLLQKHYGEKLDERAREFIQHAVSGCHRLRDRIEAILHMSRIDSNFGDLVEVDTEAALNEAISHLNQRIEETGARITHDRMPMVMSSRQLLPRLFQNLLSNAIKFSGGKQPFIHISAEHQGDFWQFSITDNGIGIAASHHDRIFRLFQRLHTQKEYRGTGLGLAICQKIVSHHGGRIWVESTPGYGSTFHFTLPTVAHC